MGNVRLAPPMPFIPAELHGKPIVALVLTYAGSIEDGEAAPASAPRARHPGRSTLSWRSPTPPTRRCSIRGYRTATTTTGSRIASARSPTT